MRFFSLRPEILEENVEGLSRSDFDDLRANLADYYDGSNRRSEEIREAITHIRQISDIKGSSRIIRAIASADTSEDGDIDGPLQEAEIVANSNREIDEVSRLPGPKGVNGEIDIQFSNGDIGESKATDASDYRPSDDRRVFRLARQLWKFETKGGVNLDGRTITIYVKEKPERSNEVADVIEELIKEETGSDVTVQFKEAGGG